MSNYKSIEGFSRYLVCDDGYVLNKEAEYVLYGNKKKTGYCEVTLFDDDGDRHTFLMHRLIARSFIPVPEDAEEVNHINGDKTDNRAINLEWVTHAQNLIHAYETGLRNNNVAPRAVIATNIETGEQMTFESIYKAARFLNVSQGNICLCCKNIRPHANGFYWEYAQGDE